MFTRALLILLAVAFVVFRFIGPRRKHRERVLRALRTEQSHADLARRFGYPRWLSSTLADLRRDGHIDVLMPDEFTSDTAREEQIRYRLRGPQRF
ncbi:MAG: hypothetical protein AAF411_17015 [Myxococcota bacterium]